MLNAALGIIHGLDAITNDVSATPTNAGCTSSAAVADCETECRNDNIANPDYTQAEEMSDEELDDSIADPDYTQPDEISGEESVTEAPDNTGHRSSAAIVESETECRNDNIADPDYTQTEEMSDEELDDSIADPDYTQPDEISDEESVTEAPANAGRISSAAIVKSENECTNDNIADADYTQAEEMSDEELDEPLVDAQSGIKVICSNSAEYFDKRPYCYFCGESQTQVQRHWMSKHRNEAEVIHLVALKDKAEKLRSITILRNKGNHLHNCDVLRTGQGDFLVTYRPKPGASADDYRPCESCWCYLRKNELYRHRCKVSRAKKGRVAANAYLLLPAPAGASLKVHELLSGMIDGDVKLVAKTDSLIVDYTSKFLMRKGMQQKVYIRDKVRELARFLIAVRKQDDMKNKTLDDCISTENFRKCVKAVNELAEFDENTATYGKPTLALKLGQALAKVAQIVKRNAIEVRNDDRIHSAELFAELCKSEWSDTIACQALGTLRERKRNKVNMLPLSADVQKLNQFLVHSSSASMSKLQDCELTSAEIEREWRTLAEATMAHVIVFNRRRQGEVSKVTIEDYNKKRTVDDRSDSVDALSPMERSLCKLFSRVEVVGKRGRTVPILFLSWHVKAIDMLIRFRTQAGVVSTNGFVFAYSQSENHLRGCDALRNASVQCGASSPQSLRATSLRKHVATLCQILNLKDHELDLLANYMGHDVRVHRHYYRLPDDVLQTSKLAKVFLMMDNGNLARQKGKTLDEITQFISSDDTFVGKLFTCYSTVYIPSLFFCSVFI